MNSVTETSGSAPEPTLSDVLAAIAALSAKVDGVDARQVEMSAQLGDVAAKLDTVAQDVVALKVDMGFIDRHIGDFQTWARRHQSNPDAHAA